MTLTTPHNGNERPSPDSSDTIPMIIAGIMVMPLLGGVFYVVFTLFQLAGVLDTP